MSNEPQETMAPSLTPLPWQQPEWRRLLEQHKAGQMAHAYLVAGEQGIGKFQFAQAFARYLLCQRPGAELACGECTNCLLGINGFHPDITLIQPEEGSRDIKIDQIRAATAFIARTSHSGLRKVIILNNAHHLNASAANSLLKTLEEPSKDTYLFLVTARADSLPATLRSRCQRLVMPTPSLEVAMHWLRAKGVAADQVESIALAAGSRPLHALTIVESDGLVHANEFMVSLAALLQRTASIQTVVTIAMKIGDSVAVEYLLQTSSIVIRSLLTNETEHPDSLKALAQIFSSFEDRTGLVKRLLLFNLAAEKSQRQLLGGTNPNAQLMLESLLWQWSSLYTQVSGKQTTDRDGQHR
ncbi:MAG: DNA polymerase III subunit delta' [Gammaproteobacteria bacterium]|nr:DNA polymerase III subunit delta' [Gammaproteobacteria bacterium]